MPPLVLDTRMILDPGNYGFSLVNGREEPLEIKSVSLNGSNVVRIVTSSDPSGCRLWYGMTLKEKLPSGPRTGARGCLRDSQGEKVKTRIQDVVYRMDNWCPFFDYPLESRGRMNKTDSR